MTSQHFEKVGLVGFASGLGGGRAGCMKGPQVIRDRRLVERICALGYQLRDFGDSVVAKETTVAADIISRVSPDEKPLPNISQIFLTCSDLYRRVLAALRENTLPLVIGGDHSLSIGSIAAVADFYREKKQEIGVLWIDTHADINTPQCSISKNIHGMPVSVLLGRVPGLLKSLQHVSPAISPEHFAYVGLRDLDDAEKEIVRAVGIRAFTMKNIDMVGVGRVMEEAIAIASAGTAGFVASFDLDVCDPTIVPGIDTPKRGGLTFREAHLVMELIHDSRKLLELEVVELNPELDIDFATSDLAVALIESALGKSIL